MPSNIITHFESDLYILNPTTMSDKLPDNHAIYIRPVEQRQSRKIQTMSHITRIAGPPTCLARDRQSNIPKQTRIS